MSPGVEKTEGETTPSTPESSEGGRIPPGRRFECGICGDSTALATHMKWHLMAHAKRRPYQCGLCGRAFTLKTRLASHLRIRAGERPFRCGLGFAPKGNLRTHGQRPHPSPGWVQRLAESHVGGGPRQGPEERLKELTIQIPIHERDLCLARLASSESNTGIRPPLPEGEYRASVFGHPTHDSADVEDHVMGVEKEARPEEVFHGEGSLRAHLPVRERHRCRTCGRVFPKKNHLRVHERTHTWKKPHLDHRKGYTARTTLRLHERTQLGQDSLQETEVALREFSVQIPIHERDLCLARIASSASKRGIRPPLPQGECGASVFSHPTHDSDDAEDHVMGAENEARHKCEEVFRGEEIPRAHLHAGEGVNHHRCQICGRTFPQKNHLRLHERTHHEKRPHLHSTCAKASAAQHHGWTQLFQERLQETEGSLRETDATIRQTDASLRELSVTIPKQERDNCHAHVASLKAETSDGTLADSSALRSPSTDDAGDATHHMMSHEKVHKGILGEKVFRRKDSREPRRETVAPPHELSITIPKHERDMCHAHVASLKAETTDGTLVDRSALCSPTDDSGDATHHVMSNEEVHKRILREKVFPRKDSREPRRKTVAPSHELSGPGYELGRHGRRRVQPDLKHKCSLCSYSSEHLGNWKRHLRRHEEGNEFGVRGKGSRHFPLRTRGKRFQYGFGRTDTLRKRRDYGGEPHLCTQYGRTRPESPSSGPSRHAWDLCHSPFASPEVMTGHRRRHPPHPESSPWSDSTDESTDTVPHSVDPGAVKPHQYLLYKKARGGLSSHNSDMTDEYSDTVARSLKKGAVNPHQCLRWAKAFATRGGLSSHNSDRTDGSSDTMPHLVAQGEVKLHQCSLYKTAFATRGGLSSHNSDTTDESSDTLVHSVKQGMVTPLCEKAFATRGCLSSHNSDMTDESRDTMPHLVAQGEVKPHQCSLYRKAFATRGGLSSHNSDTTDEASDTVARSVKQGTANPHACSLCKRAFATRGGLRDHLFVHTGERPFECDTCGTGFRRKERLRLHQETHTVERQHRCPEEEVAELVKHQGARTAPEPQQELPSETSWHEGDHSLFASSEAPTRDNPDRRHESSPDSDPTDESRAEQGAVNPHQSLLYKSTRSGLSSHNSDTTDVSSDTVPHSVKQGAVKPHQSSLCKATRGGLSSHNSDTTDVSSDTGPHSVKQGAVKPHKCSLCKRAFATRGELKDHLFVHTGDKPFECNTCGMGFRRKQSLRQHRAAHAKEKPHISSKFVKGFVRRSKLEELERTHPAQPQQKLSSEIPVFECDLCHVLFSSAEGMTRHRRRHRHPDRSALCSHSTNLSTHPCGLCGKAFSKKRSLAVHLRIHAAEKALRCGGRCARKDHLHSRRPHLCPRCGEGFALRRFLKEHGRRCLAQKPLQELPDPTACGICHAPFSSPEAITRHWRSHSHLLLPDRIYQCGLCTYSTPAYSSMRVHLMSHANWRPHKCGLCGKAFTSNGKLRRHLRVHTGEKPFVCDTCGWGFSEKNNLRKHETRMHGGGEAASAFRSKIRCQERTQVTQTDSHQEFI